jgi:septal ring factor EnvC (AmiA/AmiB activator)
MQIAVPVARSEPGDELTELRAQVAQIQRELRIAEESRGGAAEALRDSEWAISEASRKLYGLDEKLRRLNDELVGLEEQSRVLEASIRSQKARLSRWLRWMYVSGRQEALALALSGKDPGEVARQLRYLAYITRARADLLEQLKANLAALELLAADVEEKQVAITAAQSEQLTMSTKLAKARSVRAELRSRAAPEIARQRNQIGTLRRDEARLAGLADRLAELLARKAAPRPEATSRTPLPKDTPPVSRLDSSPFRQLKGRLPLPVRGEVENRFGNARSDTDPKRQGLFIRAPDGVAVHAVAAGRVVFADWLRGFGNLLVVDHGSGYMGLYGSNESLYKQVGEEIGGGEVIATVGSSGGSPESGLYFGLRFQGKAMDPTQWVWLR